MTEVRYTKEQFEEKYELVRTMTRVALNIDFQELKRHVTELAEETEGGEETFASTQRVLDAFERLRSTITWEFEAKD